MVTTLKSWTSVVRAIDTTSQVSQAQQIFFDQVDARRLCGWEHDMSCNGTTVSTTPGSGGDLLTVRPGGGGSPTSGSYRYQTSASTDPKSWWIGRRARTHDLSVDPGSDAYTYCMVAFSAVNQSATNPVCSLTFGRRYSRWTAPGDVFTLPSTATPNAAGITQTFIPWTVSGPFTGYTFLNYTANGTLLFTARQSGTFTSSYGIYYYGNEIGIRSTTDDGTGAYRTYEIVSTLGNFLVNGSTPASISSNISGSFTNFSGQLSIVNPGATVVNGWSGGSPGRDEATGEYILCPLYVTGASSGRQRRYGVMSDIRESYVTNFAEVVDGDTDPVRLVHINRSVGGSTGGLWIPVTSSVVPSLV